MSETQPGGFELVPALRVGVPTSAFTGQEPVVRRQAGKVRFEVKVMHTPHRCRELGATMVEYTILVALITVLLSAGALEIGKRTSNTFVQAAEAIYLENLGSDPGGGCSPILGCGD